MAWHGLFDDKHYWETVLGVADIYRDFRFHNLGVSPFVVGAQHEPYQYRMIKIACDMRVKREGILSAEASTILAIGETLAPHLPDSTRLGQLQARAALVADVKFSLPISVNYPNHANAFAAYLADQSHVPPAGAAPDTPTSTDCNLEGALYVLRFLSHYMHTRGNIELADVVSLVLSLAKRGTIASAKIDKIVAGIETDLNKSITLSDVTIKNIWGAYGQYINETNVGGVIDSWTNFVPTPALRLKLVLGQIANEGLTAICTIREALIAFDDFPWNEVEALFPAEKGKVEVALRAIQNCPYYGFKKDLGDVKSTNFKNIAYVCKELMIKLGGQSGLRQYAGWTRAPAHRAYLDTLISDYETNAGLTKALAAKQAGTASTMLTALP